MENQTQDDKPKNTGAHFVDQVEQGKDDRISELERTVKENEETIKRLLGEKRKMKDDYDEQLERLSKRIIQEIEEKQTKKSREVIVTSSDEEVFNSPV